MKKYRAIIVDDERLARKDLKSLLAEHKNVDIIGEADSVASAAEQISTGQPDLIFLDIQMPGESGFDLLEKVDLKAQIIFITAFDEYAIRAFEVDAVDYLLKPVNPERLKKAIDRLEKEGESSEDETKKKLQYSDTIFLTINSHPKFLKIKSIVSIQAAGDYSELFLIEGKRGIVQKSMIEWEGRLPENNFCRIHRSTIINLDHVDRIEEWFNHSYRIYMKGIENPFDMSRRYVMKIKNRLS